MVPPALARQAKGHVSSCARATDVSVRDGTVSGSWWHVHPQPGEEKEIHRNSLPCQAAIQIEHANVLPYLSCLFFLQCSGSNLGLHACQARVLLASYSPMSNIMFLTLTLSRYYIIKSQAPSYTTGEWQKPSPQLPASILSTHHTCLPSRGSKVPLSASAAVRPGTEIASHTKGSKSIY